MSGFSWPFPLVSPAAGSLVIAREQHFGGRPKLSQEPLLIQFLQSSLISSLWASGLPKSYCGLCCSYLLFPPFSAPSRLKYCFRVLKLNFWDCRLPAPVRRQGTRDGNRAASRSSSSAMEPEAPRKASLLVLDSTWRYNTALSCL